MTRRLAARWRAVWGFVAGDSRIAPVAVAAAVGAAAVEHLLVPGRALPPGAYVAILAGGLLLSVFER